MPLKHNMCSNTPFGPNSFAHLTISLKDPFWKLAVKGLMADGIKNVMAVENPYGPGFRLILEVSGFGKGCT